MNTNSNTIFVGWTRAFDGKQKLAMEVFGKFTTFLGEQQKKGNITGFTPVGLLAHGGDLNGFVLINGDHAQLSKLQTDEVFTEFVLQGTAVLSGFGVINAFSGEPMVNRLQQMSKYW